MRQRRVVPGKESLIHYTHGHTLRPDYSIVCLPVCLFVCLSVELGFRGLLRVRKRYSKNAVIKIGPAV